MAVTWPAGFRSAGVGCGIKADGLDFGLLVADAPAAWAGTFTRNAAAAAPVVWSRGRRGSQVRALAVNSGNANACTGRGGEAAAAATAEAVAASLHCAPHEVLLASTGPIGIPLPMDAVRAGVARTSTELSSDCEAFAGAILTTDTRAKISTRACGSARVVGVAKGAAMLAPNMATMLAFLCTDATASSLDDALGPAVDATFNRLDIDGCESTNDSVFLLSSGHHHVDPAALRAAVFEVCRDLAEMMAADAEGGNRVLEVLVQGAASGEDADALARAVADSVLWRAAVHGGDPNWGRIVSALGARARDLDLEAVEVWVGDVPVFVRGEPQEDRAAAAAVMARDRVAISCTVGSGPGASTVLSSDLSPEYVSLNAWGTS